MNKFFIFAHLLVLRGGGKIEIVFSVEASEIIYFFRAMLMYFPRTSVLMGDGFMGFYYCTFLFLIFSVTSTWIL